MVGRNDVGLVVGLFVAVFVVFSEPVSRLLDFVRDIEESFHLHLVPALFLLATVFSFHQLRKRQQMRHDAEVVAMTAKDATERASEMSRLVAFGHALARSMDSDTSDAIRDVTNAHIPLLAPGRSAWVMTRTRSGHWESLAAVGDSSTLDRERAARRALGEADPVPGDVSNDLCFPMIVAGEPEGVLGVAAHPPLTDHQRSVLSAAAALLGVSLKNCQLFREVHENSVRDGLTGCFNRAHALEVLDAEIRRARRSELPLSVVIFDLDNFKDINDCHGHLCGDAVLAAVGAKMKAALRGSDVKCRYGGDEFMVILPDTPIEGAKEVAQNLRREFTAHVVPWNDEQITLTASFGISSVKPGETDPLALIARADAALYRAKEHGRNDVQTEERPVLVQ
jgi:diguanylate cyclase (GGDEF)-like protein